MPSFFPANVPLVNYFFQNFTLTDPGPNIPLAGGFVFFRDDADHDLDKNTYSDVSDPNNPVVNPNPLPLNDVGAWPLFYAEEGLYYIVITDENGDFDDPIWTLEHVDFSGGAGTSGADVINYISNGQFLLHSDLPAVTTLDPATTFAAGEIREPITNIAWGGWTFERPDTSTSTDFVTFHRYTEWSDNPTGNPRYAVRIRCTDPDSGDDFKDLRYTWPDVNRFASENFYTMAFNGVDNLASDSPIDFYVIKNYGTGGSLQDEVLIETFTMGSTAAPFYIAFSFGTNEGKVIGSAGDDYVQLAWRLRTDETSDVTLTDFDLQAGDLVEPPYPETTQRQDVASALGGGFPVPNPDGSDLFLTARLTLTGWVFDDSEIGEAFYETQLSEYDAMTGLHDTSNKMLLGGFKYITADYSPLGIPYQRLFDKYFNSTANIPQYGTGSDYLSTAFAGTGNQLIVSNNAAGSVTNAANGTPSTTFTIAVIHQGDAGYDCSAYMTAASTFYIANTNAGVVTAIGAGNSGFTVATIQIGTTLLPNISSVVTIAASGISASDYFQFYTYDGSEQQRYCWFKIDGAGADPAPGGLGVEVDLLSTDSAAIVAQKIQTSLNGWEVTTIHTVAASAIPTGSNFLIDATGQGYYVWYTKAGVGTDPDVGGRVGILVALVGNETDTQVATKTQIAMNSYSFAIPDVRGWFVRVANSGATVDPGVRYSYVPGIIGTDEFGTYELSQNISHIHDPEPTPPFASFPIFGYATIIDAGGNTAVGVDTAIGVATTTFEGGTEGRPISINFPMAIRY